ncbi:FGGY family carbohydrate kinase [Bosea sp. NPDC055332]
MSAAREVILAIDEGTSGTRAAVVDAGGVVSCLTYQPLSVDAPRPGVVEQDADALLASTLDVCRSTIAQAECEGLRIVALALATQRASCVLWDRANGRALVPAMVWQDTQYAAELGRLAPAWDQRLTAEIGRPTGVRSPYLWAARHIEQTTQVARAFRAGRLAFGTIDTWLLWHLSARRQLVTTPTNATSAGAYMLAEHRYQHDWLDTLGFPATLLPELREDADDFGRTDPTLLGIDVPILASIGDQHAGAIGLGCLERGQSMCIHGTGSFVDLIVGPEPPAQASPYDGTLIMTARRQKGATHLAVETFAATTGSALNWLCEEMRWFEAPSQISELAASVTSANGIAFLPALTGWRIPRIQPAARAALSGLSMASSRAELAYAILEGIAQSVALSLKANEEVAGVAVKELIVGGGLSNSDALLQMQADLAGVPIRRKRDTARATLRGAAYLAGSSGLFWDTLPREGETEQPDDVFEARITASERALRCEQWQARLASELEHAGRTGAASQDNRRP